MYAAVTGRDQSERTNFTGDILYFTADNGQDGRELWKVDTGVSFFNYDAVKVRDINPGASGSNASHLNRGTSCTFQQTTGSMGTSSGRLPEPLRRL